MTDLPIFSANTEPDVALQEVVINNEKFFKIANHDLMRPFFMSIVSDSNHWMFISSNGGLTAGRKNAEFALFPYYTDDKLTELVDSTGSKTIFQIHLDEKLFIWEPFSDRFNDSYSISRNLYKSIYGNSIIFEEVLHDLQLTFRYQWSNSNEYGFIKTSEIRNQSNKNYQISILDGIQNVMPFGVPSDLQATTSNLVDAYKRTELHSDYGLGIFTLSAIIVDKAEPSEALKANVVWSLGLDNATYALSSLQLPNFRKGQTIQQESDVKGEKGAYFIASTITLSSMENKSWKIIANVNQNQSQILQLIDDIGNDPYLNDKVIKDIELGTKNLIALNATADGLQFTADHRKDTRHFSNVLFNIMRGGVFDQNYSIEREDFVRYIKKANISLYQQHPDFFDKLPENFDCFELRSRINTLNNVDLIRLGVEYLPLKFSRRHGDPSRPWNKFSINTTNEIDGSKVLDYQGNWRDIFQNWEALAFAYPEFIEGMIFKFLNASTFDGYNPYRVTKDGFDWETIEPDNPWSYIGYWGDHQIIYLLKFLEFIENYQPGKLNSFFDKEYFVYAAVPYTIKPYEALIQDPKNTIQFDHQWDAKINKQRSQIGSDGTLCLDIEGNIYHVNLIEKILATVLAKMANFIPEAGIWMNTQRPEWNDANNALVGNGVSMVTLYYLRRFFKFLEQILEHSNSDTFRISNEMVEFYHAVRENLIKFRSLLDSSIGDKDRKEVMDALGKAASDYRTQIYQSGFWGKKRTHSIEGLKQFVTVSLEFLEHTIKLNQRSDKLFHAYNLISISNDEVSISHLPEMLEGQVAILSSGYLSSSQSLEVLDALQKSSLYRTDQSSYILYPNKELPKFLEKNTLTQNQVDRSILLKKLLQSRNQEIINQDIKGNYHFNGNFNNVNSLKIALNQLSTQSEYTNLVTSETDLVCAIFEEVFNHKAFTGRSGTFYGYEGLGSIYWHMVSKLHLAVLEVIQQTEASENDLDSKKLIAHFDAIAYGIGTHKSPKEYGAFPTDPYSHTPFSKGAQQPGMTGQVKEDILTRIGELGVRLKDGKLMFYPSFLSKNEFLRSDKSIQFIRVDGTKHDVLLPKESLAFSCCQVLVIYKIASHKSILIHKQDKVIQHLNTLELDEEHTKMVVQRSNEVVLIEVNLSPDCLR